MPLLNSSAPPRPWWVRRRRPIALAAVALGIAALLAAGDVGGQDAPRSVRVDALWYGTAADGSIASGVTPVGITAEYDDPSTPLLVDVGGLRAAGAGPMWTAATAVAEIQAVLIAGVDPRKVQVSYALKEAIDGPSAGALLSSGSLAAIRGVRTDPRTTMTGTVLPDGSVGPVSGISDKLRAAKAAGYDRVLVPVGPSVDLTTGKPVDLVAFGRTIGVEVIPVSDVPQAYALLTGTLATTQTPQASPIAPGILRMLERRARSLEADGRTQLQKLASARDPQVQSALPGIRAWLTVAQQELDRGDAIRAFASAAEAGQALQESAALERAHRQTALPLTTRIALVRQEVGRARQVIRAALLQAAATPVTTVEQVAAMPDALAWGIFALTSMDVADEQLRTVSNDAELDTVIRFVETGRFESDTYMAATTESLQFVGRQRLADPARTAQQLDAYATLIAYGAEANGAYADSLPSSSARSSYLRDLINDSHPLATGKDPSLGAGLGPTARPALRLGAALLEYVETTQLVNDLTSRPLTDSSSPPNTLPIKNPAVVARQARTAADISAGQTAAIATAGLDPSYVQWNSRWGQELAFGRLPEITDEQTLHGLEYQWFAVLNGRVLLALSRQ